MRGFFILHPKLFLRVAVFSAIYLTILGSSQYVAYILLDHFGKTNFQSVIISGTSIMIITTVSIETIQQIEARKKAQNILKTSKKDQISNKDFEPSNKNQENSGSVLW